MYDLPIDRLTIATSRNHTDWSPEGLPDLAGSLYLQLRVMQVGLKEVTFII